MIAAPAVLRTALADTGNIDVLQTVTASIKGEALPSSTGQIVPRAIADEVIAINRKLAPNFGYRVGDDGAFTDPASGVAVLQGYVPAAPDYIIPTYPPEGARPQPIVPESWGPGTLKLFVWGQSLASNAGHGRYAARNSERTCVYADGNFYPCSDPIVGADGPGGSVWSRFADAVLGRPFNHTKVNQVVIGCCAQGGTSIDDWAPGGNRSPLLLRSLADYIASVGMPTHLAFSQGETDVERLSAAQWFDRWRAMLASVRTIGCTSKIWTSIESICNLRAADDPYDEEAIRRMPNSYVNREIGRQIIRTAQKMAGTLGSDTRQGPNLDLIDWRLRACGDGCHFGAQGLAAAGQAWATALTD